VVTVKTVVDVDVGVDVDVNVVIAVEVTTAVEVTVGTAGHGRVTTGTQWTTFLHFPCSL
jgi:hypothetical protein